MVDKYRRSLNADPFAAFKLKAYGEEYLVPSSYHSNYHPPTGYLTIFLNDDDHTLIHGGDIESITEGIGD